MVLLGEVRTEGKAGQEYTLSVAHDKDAYNVTISQGVQIAAQGTSAATLGSADALVPSISCFSVAWSWGLSYLTLQLGSHVWPGAFS